ncbi:hypothetical protein BTUL_0098g00390 [Botrytis tulipae]|uniref:Uncharacterized protein n=1 Tax=Botrytis tulipae TaxID=87230 RepID=A0A4Z1EHR1_9HELO|nr:hypothetical protein BTUL_0098g00390 [Botrytis tulipae]
MEETRICRAPKNDGGATIIMTCKTASEVAARLTPPIERLLALDKSSPVDDSTEFDNLNLGTV